MPSALDELQKNDDIDTSVETLGYRGEGVARVGRVPVFVQGALPGERIRAHIILVKKDYAVGKLTDVSSPSPDRVDPGCPYFGKCGGCNIRHLAYPAQLEFKRGIVRDALRKIAHIDADVAECVPSPDTSGCRNKLSLPVRAGERGAKVGLFAYNSHRVVEIEDCPLQTPAVRRTIPALRRLAARYAPYDEEKGRGVLRHFVARDLNGKLSLTVVATSDISEGLADAVAAAGIKADELWLNVNRSRTNAILGDKTVLVAGKPVLYEFMGLHTHVHPRGFLQVNGPVAEKLYGAVLDVAARLSPAAVIDAYSGGGLLTALLARVAREVTGIEIERAAVDSANELFAREGISNARTVAGDCADVLPGLVADSDADALVVLDPPRSGCSPEVIAALNDSRAAHVVYVSCDPSTLSRDLSLLTAYRPLSVTPFDMFPNTCHVETLICLERK